MSDDTWVPALLTCGLVALVVISVVVSKRKSPLWIPTNTQSKCVPCNVSVNNAYSWYSSAKQDKGNNPLGALVKLSYASSCLREVQGVASLAEVHDVNLPVDIDGAEGLSILIGEEHASLMSLLSNHQRSRAQPAIVVPTQPTLQRPVNTNRLRGEKDDFFQPLT